MLINMEQQGVIHGTAGCSLHSSQLGISTRDKISAGYLCEATSDECTQNYHPLKPSNFLLTVHTPGDAESSGIRDSKPLVAILRYIKDCESI